MTPDYKRWYFTFYDDNGNQHTLNIYDSTYLGAATEITAGATPVLISWGEPGSDKYINYIASELTAELVSTTSLMYLDLFAYGSRRFYCNFYREGTLFWHGYAMPELYSEPLTPVPYITSVRFSDGIALLKNTTFTPPAYTSGAWKQTLIYYVKQALAQISNQLPIHVAVDLDFTSGGAGSVTSRPMENIYIDWRRFINEDGSYWTWFEVLDNICKSLQARIYQNAGAWVLERVDQKRSTYDYDIYSYVGTYTTTVTGADSRTALTTPTVAAPIVFRHDPAMLEISSGHREFTIAQEYGQRPTLLNCNNWFGDFTTSEFNSGVPRFWSEVAGGVAREIAAEDALQIDTVSGSVEYANYLQSDDIDFATLEPAYFNTLFNDWMNGKINLRLKYKVKLNFAEGYGITSLTSATRLRLDCSGTAYYVKAGDVIVPVSDTPEWTTDTSTGFIKYQLVDENLHDWHEIDISLATPPAAEQGNTQTSLSMRLLFFEPRVTASNPSVGFAAGDGLMIKGVQIFFEKNEIKYTGKSKYKNKIKFIDKYIGSASKARSTEEETIIEDNPTWQREQTYTLDADNLTTPDDYRVTFGDTKNYNGAYTTGGQATLNKYVFEDSSGYPINYFSRHGDGQQESLIFTINRLNLQTTYRQAMIKLRGAIVDRADALSFRSILEDYDSRYYLPIAQTWDVRGAIWEGEWLNFWPSTQGGDFNSDFSEDFLI